MTEKLYDWRVAWAGLVVVLAMVGFTSGVETTQRTGMEGVGVFGHLYYTLTLFLVAGTELGLPTGGPVWGRGCLWVAYFGAPALTVSALVEALVGILNPRGWRLQGLEDHAIVVGAGHLARSALTCLERRDFGGRVAVVTPSFADQPIDTEAFDLPTVGLETNILEAGAFDRLHVGHAESVMLMTSRDCANLEVASRIEESTPAEGPGVMARVSEIDMLRELQRSEMLGRVRLFNGHRLAARQLVEQKLLTHFRETGAEDQVAMVGFDKFGQTVLEQLQRRAGDMIRRVVLADRDVDGQAALFDDQVGFASNYERIDVDGDPADPRTWRAIDEHLAGDGAAPVFVLGTPDEDLNLRRAMLQWRRHGESLFVVRSYYHPSLAGRMERRGDFEIHNVGELLLDGLGELMGR
jgi:hypothetical protein